MSNQSSNNIRQTLLEAISRLGNGAGLGLAQQLGANLEATNPGSVSYMQSSG